MHAAISISNLALDAHVGVTTVERGERQSVIVNIQATVDVMDALASDAFVDTVDYKAIVDSCEEIVRVRQFTLVETLASTITDVCLVFPRVTSVTVRAEKPRKLLNIIAAGVELTRNEEARRERAVSAGD